MAEMLENKYIVLTSGLGVKVKLTKVPDKKYLIIPHRTCLNLIKERKITYHFGDHGPIVSHHQPVPEVIFTCYMTDPETGWQSVGVGEANELNLDSEIGMKFPAEMAANRAVDRALIQLLNFDASVYSDCEMNYAKKSKDAEDVKTGEMTYVLATNVESLEQKHPKQPEGDKAGDKQGGKKVDIVGNKVGNKTEISVFAPYDSQKKPVTTVKPEDTFDPPVARTMVSEFANDTVVIDDDEVILIGACKGYKYGEVKGSIRFKEFLKYIINNPDASFNSDKKNEQASRLRRLRL